MKGLFISLFVLLISSHFSYADNIDIVYHSPQSNANNCTVNETIIFSVFEEINQATIDNSIVSVTGSTSGSHTGMLFLAKDGNTLIFKPDIPFNNSETVNVNIGAGLGTISGNTINQYSFSFNVRNPRTVVDFTNFDPYETRIPYSKIDFKLFNNDVDDPGSEPNANVAVNLNPSHGRIFISGFRGDTVTFTPYLTIYDNSGSLLLSQSTFGPSVDFKKQINGTYSYCSLAKSLFYILDSNFNVIDSVSCGNGYTTDLHELLVLGNGNMLIMGYDTVEVDMSQIVTGGDTNALVAGLIVQELDKDKNVVYQWRSWEEMEITDASHEDFTASKIDYAHGNSIEPDYDGNLLVSSRHLDEITKIDRKTGKIIWRLGGKKNQFTFVNDDRRFSHQHDARRIAPGRITLFDNGNFHDPYYSRVIEYELDEINKTATLVWQFDHDKTVHSPAMGNAQRLSNGNTLIGWGFTQPNVTEVTPWVRLFTKCHLTPAMYPIGHSSIHIINPTLHIRMITCLIKTIRIHLTQALLLLLIYPGKQKYL